MAAAEGLPFALPAEEPFLASRSAFAPKLMRRANGVVGMLEAGGLSSSKGLSSTDPEFALEMLSARGRVVANGMGWLFHMPFDNPTVFTERRRGPKLGGGAAGRPNMSTKEERRLPTPEGLWLELDDRRSSDMLDFGLDGEDIVVYDR